MKSQESRRYPIGKFEYGKTWSLDETRRNIKAIARLPKELKKALKKLKNSDLDTPYRKGGWTARQVVHHIADSHMNAYVRMKLAVTEPTPIIKPYEEANWAETEDSKNASVKLSLKLLTPLHKRWVMFLESLSEEDLERGYFHPAQQKVIALPEAIALYAWHGQHHVAHIRLIAQGKPEHDEKEKSAPAQEGRKPQKATKAEGPKLSRAEILAKARAARAAQQVSVAAPAASSKRIRRSSAEVAAEKAAKAAAPKLSRAEVLAKARAARAAKAPAKPKKADTTPKRTRRSSAEVAAEKAAKAAVPKLSRAEVLAKARAARAAKAPAKPKKATKPEVPKLSRAEALAKARAARAAKAPAKPKKADTAPKRTRRSSAEVAAEKAAKAAAPKLSRAEALTKARAARAAKAPAKPKKAAKPEGPKLSRNEILANARAAKKPASPKAEAAPKAAKSAGRSKKK